MSNEQETLGDFVRRVANEKGLSQREVARRSGGLISHVTVGDIINKNRGDVKTETLRGLAKGLGVTEEEVFAVARGKKPEDDPDFLKSRLGLLSLKFDKIPIDKRVNVEALIELLDREVERLTKK
ncbi:MAG TPA: helix-turn-helix transcriptional regulator [Pyrinomonadaceae bacterium]